MGLPRIAQHDTGLGQTVVALGLLVGQRLAPLRPARAARQEIGLVGHRRLGQHRQQRGVLLRALLSAVALAFVLADLALELRQPVAALLADRALELLHLSLLGIALLGSARAALCQTVGLLGQCLQAALQQRQTQRGEMRGQEVAAGAQRLDLGQVRGMTLTVGHQRRQPLDLVLGLQHRFVCPTQVVEVDDQRIDAWRHVEGLEHVGAHEIGQVAHRLHRHRLREEFQRLLVVDAEAPAEPRAVAREGILDLRALRAQAATQHGDVGAEAGEVVRDRQRALGRHVQTRRRGLRLAQPEYLCQRDRLVVAGVVEDAQDHAGLPAVAQAHRTRRASALVALGLVVAQHVGAQRALARFGPRGLVVGDAVRRHQQRRHRVHQRRLARADVAGQQCVAPVELQRPNPRVEGAPVQHLQPLQTETRACIVGSEVQPVRQSGRGRSCRRRQRGAGGGAGPLGPAGGCARAARDRRRGGVLGRPRGRRQLRKQAVDAHGASSAGASAPPRARPAWAVAEAASPTSTPR